MQQSISFNTKLIESFFVCQQRAEFALLQSCSTGIQRENNRPEKKGHMGKDMGPLRLNPCGLKSGNSKTNIYKSINLEIFAISHQINEIYS